MRVLDSRWEFELSSTIITVWSRLKGICQCIGHMRNMFFLTRLINMSKPSGLDKTGLHQRTGQTGLMWPCTHAKIASFVWSIVSRTRFSPKNYSPSSARHIKNGFNVTFAEGFQKELFVSLRSLLVAADVVLPNFRRFSVGVLVRYSSYADSKRACSINTVYHSAKQATDLFAQNDEPEMTWNFWTRDKLEQLVLFVVSCHIWNWLRCQWTGTVSRHKIHSRGRGGWGKMMAIPGPYLVPLSKTW